LASELDTAAEPYRKTMVAFTSLFNFISGSLYHISCGYLHEEEILPGCPTFVRNFDLATSPLCALQLATAKFKLFTSYSHATSSTVLAEARLEQHL
jgi:hypothetical protein